MLGRLKGAGPEVERNIKIIQERVSDDSGRNAIFNTITSVSTRDMVSARLMLSHFADMASALDDPQGAAKAAMILGRDMKPLENQQTLFYISRIAEVVGPEGVAFVGKVLSRIGEEPDASHMVQTTNNIYHLLLQSKSYVKGFGRDADPQAIKQLAMKKCLEWIDAMDNGDHKVFDPARDTPLLFSSPSMEQYGFSLDYIKLRTENPRINELVGRYNDPLISRLMGGSLLRLQIALEEMGLDPEKCDSVYGLIAAIADPRYHHRGDDGNNADREADAMNALWMVSKVARGTGSIDATIDACSKCVGRIMERKEQGRLYEDDASVRIIADFVVKITNYLRENPKELSKRLEAIGEAELPELEAYKRLSELRAVEGLAR
jgi:hypothetical protein